jgi:phage gpG-like protein
MPATITGMDQVNARLRDLANHHPERALPIIGAAFLEKVGESFERESDPYGTPWQKLAASTIKRRRKNSSTILSDTGRLRRSFSSVVRGDTLVIGTNDQKAEYHMSTEPRTYMPFRSALPWKSNGSGLELPEEWMREALTTLEDLYGLNP